jgi:hypothetical protein
MVNVLRHYLRLLRVEIQDMLEEIEMLIEHLETRFACDDISSYVRLENEGVLRRELGAIGHFIALVDEIEPANYKSIPEMEQDILSRADEIVKKQEQPEVVLVLLKRKIDKVREFISAADKPPITR